MLMPLPLLMLLPIAATDAVPLSPPGDIPETAEKGFLVHTRNTELIPVSVDIDYDE